MSQYKPIELNLSDGQKNKIRTGLQSQGSVTIRLKHSDLNGGTDILGLTQRQMNKIVKAYENGKGVTITLSNAQLKENMKVEGGIIGLLAAGLASALPFIAKAAVPALATGALSGLASSAAQKIIKKGKGLYLKKGGCVCEIQSDGSGLYLKSHKGNAFSTVGNGLYLKSGGKLITVDVNEAKELVKKIPLLNLLLKN